ncbi:MAG: hypothetical protein VB018_03865 [Lachnospiraceae bacterium]|nr:hypothetical protein [Lachnospiraceae bacterium]
MNEKVIEFKETEPFKSEKDETKTVSTENVVFGLFGCSLQQLIYEIQTNKGGKYSALYK